MSVSHNKAMVVLSGGQDSTTCLAWASRYFSEVHAVTFNYGQRHIRELDAAINVAKIFRVASHEVINLGPGILAGRSPLTDPQAQLEQYQDHDSMAAIIGDRVELTFVPMRNALFFTVAANRAICKDINILVTGVCEADNANYPDCRARFLEAQEQAINEALGLNGFFRIYAPLMTLSKDASVQLMMSLDEFPALAFTHTAYDGAYPPVGMDHATILRAHGFEKAGQPDPLVVRAVREGLMAYPDTANYDDRERCAALADQILALGQKFGVLR